MTVLVMEGGRLGVDVPGILGPGEAATAKAWYLQGGEVVGVDVTTGEVLTVDQWRWAPLRESSARMRTWRWRPPRNFREQE